MKLFKRETPFESIVAAVRATIAERAHLTALIENAHGELAGCQAKLDSIRVGLEDAEVAAVLGTGGSTDAQRAELAGLYASGDAIEARITGLKRRLAESDTQLERSQATLGSARAEWNRQQIAAFEERYMKVVDEFRAITRQALALGLALADETVCQAAHDNCAFGLFSGVGILEETRHAPYAASDCSPDWEVDPKAKALFEQSSGPRLVDQELTKLIADVRIQPARAAWKAKEEETRQRAERFIKEAGTPDKPDAPRTSLFARRTA